MKTTGVVRQLDALGRIVLPIELRRTLDIKNKDLLEILVEGSNIVLRKYEQSCQFCGSSRELAVFKDKLVCKSCLQELKSV